ncbi:MAG TPA: protein-export chaperone SecB [Burkholderiales bacterium]|nr:protein-export chaperone SecB [Burkholderiales bacterium]
MSDNQPSFQIEKIYVKDLSLEIPGGPQTFVQGEQPRLEVQIGNDAAQFAEGYYEVAVTVTVTARAADKTVFLVEAVQAGIFSIRGVPQGDLPGLLNVACPTIIYPYLRETVSDVITRGGFPPVLLAPVSFEALYAQRQQQAGAQPRIEIAS